MTSGYLVDTDCVARRLIADFDLLLGATALRHDLTLLTNNRRDFEAIRGLAIEILSPSTMQCNP